MGVDHIWYDRNGSRHCRIKALGTLGGAGRHDPMDFYCG